VQAPGDPQSLNRYAYARNNPQSLIDPSGHFWLTKLFKAIGNFFKNIVKNPGMFLASVIMGIATGGVATAAGASLWAAAAIGGAAGSMTAAAMSKGNIWQAGLIGGIAGAVGGAVGGLAGAAAGGATAGALGTAFNGGNFAVNVFAGGITAGIVYGAGRVLGAALSNETAQTSDSGMIRFAANNTSGDVLSDASPNSGDPGTWWDRFKADLSENVRINHEVIYGTTLGDLTKRGVGFLATGAFARDVGTLTWKDALLSLPAGGVANLGRVGTLLSATVTTIGHSLAVAGTFEASIWIGSGIRASVTATMPDPQAYRPPWLK